MSERTTISQVVQIGAEAIPGTAVAANRRLQAIAIEPGIKAEVQSFRPMGGKFPVLSALGKEWTEAKISGQAAYNDLAFLLASVLSYDEPVQQGATAAYLWSFEPGQSVEDVVKTFTVEAGSSVRAGRFAYGLVTELGLKADRESVEVSGSMLGQQYEDGITLTAGATAVEPVPVLPTQIDVFLDDTSAELGDTQLTRVLSAEFNISDRFGPLWVLNSALGSWATHVETEPKATLKLLVEADDEGMALLPVLRAGDKRFIRLQATGPTIEDAYTYLLQLDMCVTVAEVGEFSDEDGVYAIEWTFNATYDATWGTALTCALTNTLADLGGGS